MKLINKMLCATAIATISGAANASPIWIDTGSDFNSSGSASTATFDAATVAIGTATSTLIGGTCDGSTCTPNATSTFSESGSGFISNLLPISNPLLESNGLGLASGWGLSFEYSGLTGDFSGPLGTPVFDAGGSVDIFFTDNTTGKSEQMAQFNILGGGPLLGESNMFGVIDYSWLAGATDTGETAADAKTFFNSVPSLTGENSFYEIWDNWKDQQENPLTWLFNFTITGNNTTAFADNGDTTGSRTTALHGPLSFSVPEPTSIAILGLGLMGFAASRKRKQS